MEGMWFTSGGKLYNAISKPLLHTVDEHGIHKYVVYARHDGDNVFDIVEIDDIEKISHCRNGDWK